MMSDDVIFLDFPFHLIPFPVVNFAAITSLATLVVRTIETNNCTAIQWSNLHLYKGLDAD